LKSLLDSQNDAVFGEQAALSRQGIEEENKNDQRKMGGSVIVDIQREPVTFQIDEAGMAVYTLPNYLSARFKEIFDQIDADM